MTEAKEAPKHVAIIMDGNGRWAQARNKSRSFGHKSGIENAKQIVIASYESQIRYLTLFAFSKENWKRPLDEVNAIFQLISANLYTQDIDWIQKREISIRILGELSELPQTHQRRLLKVQEETRHFKKMHLNIAINYGGRWDLVQAATRLLNLKDKGTAISEQELEAQLETAGIPDPELIIRTGGESRISNFLLWQSAYSELYFSDIMWPDFSKEHLKKALTWYCNRQRRFGGVPLTDTAS